MISSAGNFGVPPPRVEAEPRTWVAVVIPAFNAERTISQALRAVLAQSIHPAQVIVVDDGSTDSTGRIVESMAPVVQLVSQSNSGPAAARNAGVHLARTEFIAFTDSDCVPHRDWLKDLLTEFHSPEIAGVGGVVRGIENGVISRYLDSCRLMQPVVDANGKVEFVITANAIFRRDAILQAGLFSTRFKKPGGEEPDLCRRLRDRGYQLRATAGGLVEHHHKSTIGAFVKTLANYGEGRFLLAQMYPEYSLPGDPRAALIRHLFSVSRLWKGMRWRRRGFGFRNAVMFSALDHLDRAAGLYGYMRGCRAAALAATSVENSRCTAAANSSKGPHVRQ